MLAGVCLLLTPVFDRALNLQSTVTAAIVALVVWPMTLVGGEAGILQGERRWLPLAGFYLSMGLARLAGTLLLLWKPEEWVAALSMAIGFTAPAIVGWLALRRSAAMRSRESTGHHDERAIVRELGANSHALLAFFALSNADVILSRFVLDPHSSGLYAGGLILVKSLLFLPQFVIIVAFPSMSTAGCASGDPRQERGRDPGPRRPSARSRSWCSATSRSSSSEDRSTPASRTSCGSSPCWARCSRPCSCSSTASWPGSRVGRST